MLGHHLRCLPALNQHWLNLSYSLHGECIEKFKHIHYIIGDSKGTKLTWIIKYNGCFSVNTSRWANAVSMLVHRLRRWPNNGSTTGIYEIYSILLDAKCEKRAEKPAVLRPLLQPFWHAYLAGFDGFWHFSGYWCYTGLFLTAVITAAAATVVLNWAV